MHPAFKTCKFRPRLKLNSRPTHEFNNIEKPSMTHWAMRRCVWWCITYVRRRRRTPPHTAEIGVRKTSKNNNFCVNDLIYLNDAALESAWLALQLRLFQFLSYCSVRCGCNCDEFWSSFSTFLLRNSNLPLIDRSRRNKPKTAIDQILKFTLSSSSRV